MRPPYASRGRDRHPGPAHVEFRHLAGQVALDHLVVGTAREQLLHQHRRPRGARRARRCTRARRARTRGGGPSPRARRTARDRRTRARRGSRRSGAARRAGRRASRRPRPRCRRCSVRPTNCSGSWWRSISSNAFGTASGSATSAARWSGRRQSSYAPPATVFGSVSDPPMNSVDSCTAISESSSGPCGAGVGAQLVDQVGRTVAAGGAPLGDEVDEVRVQLGVRRLARVADPGDVGIARRRTRSPRRRAARRPRSGTRAAAPRPARPPATRSRGARRTSRGRRARRAARGRARAPWAPAA